MNSKNEIKNNPMLYISFNQDNTFFSIGTEQGFLIYQTDPFKGPYERKMGGGIGIVEMIDNSNFLALMGGGEIPKYSKNKVVIWDDHENRVIAELKFMTTILRIKYLKEYLFIVCQRKIYIFNFNTYELLDTIDTCNNMRELIATNQTVNPLIVAYPSPKEEYAICIKNFSRKENPIISFKAQDDPISKICMNFTGTLLVSANEHGTIIRIHSCLDGAFLQEFKRGFEKAKINSICFDNDTKFMAVSSSRGTIHIFSMGSTFKKLKENEIKKKREEKNKKDKKNKKNKKDKKKKNKKDDDHNKKEKQDDEIKEGKNDEKKDENKIEENKINDEINENKIETDNTDENKIEDEKQEDKLNGDDININKNNDKIDFLKDVQEEEIAKGEEESNMKIKNRNKQNEINQNEFIEITENPEEEELPQNSKTFLGGIFGSKTEKSFAKIRLKSQESICAFIKSDIIAVVTSDNKYYQFQLNVKNGGDYKEIFKEDLIKNN